MSVTNSVRLASLARWWAANRAIVLQAFVVFMTMRVVLSVLAVLFVAIVPEQVGQHYTVHMSDNVWVDVWARWDAEHYIDLAKYGYELRSTLTAFYPLLPMMMALFAPLFGGDVVLAGLVISSVACFLTLIYMFKLAELEFDKDTAGRTMLYLAAYPTAFFMYAIYTESLFLVLSLAVFYHARRQQWAIAAVAMALAAISRPTGIILSVPLLWEVWVQCGPNIRKIGFTHPFKIVREVGFIKLLTLAAPSLVTVIYGYYMYTITGDPLDVLNSRSQPPWGRRLAPPWEVLDLTLQHLSLELPNWDRAISSFELGFAVFLVLLTVIGWFALPRIYGIYFVVSTLLLVSSTLPNFPTQSMPRYTLAVFPIYFLLAKLGKDRNWNNAILFGSLLMQGVLMAMFCNWYWVF